MSYTIQEKQKAIELYYQYDKSIAATIRKLGYPTVTALRNLLKITRTLLTKYIILIKKVGV